MFDFDESEFRRRNLRIPGYDYTQDGAYFVTICAEGKRNLFGRVFDEKMKTNSLGLMIEKVWKEIPDFYPGVYLDLFVVMPNHLHGIVCMNVGAAPCGRPAPKQAPGPAAIFSLPDIVHRFKSYTTNAARRLFVDDDGTPLRRLWQRNYYEHVIRNDESLRRIREYIQNNPLRWHLDRENPGKNGRDPFDAWLDSFKLRHRVSR